MAATVTGVVTHGVIVPSKPLPEGARVDIQLRLAIQAGDVSRPTPSELRQMPRKDRQAILAAAAELAEEDYRND